MTIRVGINGFGRMGRLSLRAAWGFDPANPVSLREPAGVWGDGTLELVHVNEINGDVATAAHLLKFDSVHGTWPIETAEARGGLAIGDRWLSYSAEASPNDVDWEAFGVDLVLECTGKLKSMAALAPYFERGAKKVIVAAPVREPEVLNVVMGVNDSLYDPAHHDVLTAASCTTNCLAPVVKVVHEGIGIEHGSITTIHDVTNTQTVVDAAHTDLRRARVFDEPNTDFDWLRDGNRNYLSGVTRKIERHGGPCAAAQRLNYRLRVRGEARDVTGRSKRVVS